MSLGIEGLGTGSNVIPAFYLLCASGPLGLMNVLHISLYIYVFSESTQFVRVCVCEGEASWAFLFMRDFICVLCIACVEVLREPDLDFTV